MTACKDRAGEGVGWHRVTVKKNYQSEPAMSYHILTRNASCLPMDLPHREAFYLHSGRKDFSYGVDKRAVALWAALQEQEEEEFDDDNATATGKAAYEWSPRDDDEGDDDDAYDEDDDDSEDDDGADDDKAFEQETDGNDGDGGLENNEDTSNLEDAPRNLEEGGVSHETASARPEEGPDSHETIPEQHANSFTRSKLFLAIALVVVIVASLVLVQRKRCFKRKRKPQEKARILDDLPVQPTGFLSEEEEAPKDD